MSRRRSRTAKLRAELAEAISAERVNHALELYELIESQHPGEPRWPHRKGDLLQRMGRKADAVLAYERSVELYAANGFVARAAAMAKVILAIDPSKGEVLERVDPEVAQKLRLQSQSAIAAADKTETPGLELSDVELFARPTPPEPRVSLRPSAGTLAQLPSMLLFAEVPRDILSVLVRRSTLIDAEDGQRFVTAGTAADALYVLVQGNAVAQRATDTQSLLLGEGDVAGVSCLLANVSYGEDVTACASARLLRISKTLLDELVERHPPFRDLLLEILGRRLVATLFRTSPIFTTFDEDTRTQIAHLFEVRRAVAGTKLLEAGKLPSGMCVPLHGRIVARREDGTRIGDMHLGHPLGQESILTRNPALITVEAATDAILLHMPVEAFSDLLLRRPDVVQQIGSSRRRQSGQNYSSGAMRISAHR
jgi:CRP-like cAMP-binding protein